MPPTAKETPAPPAAPAAWVLPNRAQFLDWVPSAFKKSLSKTAAAAAKLFPHQAFVRDYLQHAGPYRGMLLYHGLGAGKTCAAITTSTKLFEDTDGLRKPVVFLPASLRQNFIDEIKKCGPVWMRPQQEWVFMPNPDGDADIGEKVHPYAPPPGALVAQHGGLWVPASLASPPPSFTETKTKAKTGKRKGSGTLGQVAFDRLSTDSQNQIRRQIDAMIDAHYTFYAYNGLQGKHVTALEKGKLNVFDHKVIIIDEVHNFVSRVMNGRILIRLYQLLMEAKDAKMILLSGTPIINRPNELSYIMNLATGYVPVVTLRYQASSTFSDERVKTFLKEHPHVDDAELRDDDTTITLTLVPDGFERKSSDSYGLVRTSDGEEEGAGEQEGAGAKDLNARVLAIKDQLRKMGIVFADDATAAAKKPKGKAKKAQKGGDGNDSGDDDADWVLAGGAPKKAAAAKGPVKPYEVAYETRLPFDAEAMTDRFLDFETSKLKNPDMLTRRLLGAVSYFHTFPKEIYPTLLEPKLVKAKMTETQFSKYSELRDKEIEIELRAKKNKKKRSGSNKDSGAGGSSGGKKNPFADNGGVYRTFSRALCNFVFPESIPRPFPYNLRASARELDRVEEEQSDYKKTQEGMKDAANDMVEEGLLERTDMDAELDDAQSEAGDASDAESGNAEAKENASREQRGGAPKAKPKSKKMAAAAEDFQNTYLRIIGEAKAALAANPVFLTTDLGEYSPKMAKMIKSIQKAPGSCLVYSQFRMVEGLGVLSLALDAHGFVELKVRKTGLGGASSSKGRGRGKKAASSASTAGSWELDLAKADYHKPKYIRFTSDKEATKILMDIFNSNVKDLPPNIAKVLPELHSVPENAEDAASRRQLNLYGSIVKVMMVTQSGSEGISLKNVRQVHVMEPYWNDVRIKQVIGRAVRAHSHVDLPDKDRNVQVFMYQSVLDEEMARKNYRIRTIDQGTTSDAFVAKLAQKKKVIVDQLMDALRRAAVDCRMQANQSDCFKVPSNWQADRRISPAAIALEQTDEEQSRRLETRTTKVTKELKELLIKGRRYYYEKGTEALYDVEQSKAKGKLVQVGHMVIKQNPETGKKVRAAVWDANANANA